MSTPLRGLYHSRALRAFAPRRSAIASLLVACALLGSLLTGALRAQQPAANAAGDPGPIEIGPQDWPWWRGPSHDGVAPEGPQPPRQWTDGTKGGTPGAGGLGEHILWQAPVPGRGHGSPTVVGDHVYLATAEPDREVQGVSCYHRETGELVWRTDVHEGGWEKKGNAKASLASSSVACDGRRLFINFLHAGAAYTTALDRAGRMLWQTKICDYTVHQGYGSSPTLYGPLVIVSADNKAGGAVAALHRATGEVVWSRGRPALPNYASPIVHRIGGKDQLLLTGCDLVTSLDPLSGKPNWEFAGATTECVTTTLTDGERLFTSGGYPKNHLAAMRVDGSGKVDWEHNTRVYVPSLLLREGRLFGVLDAGVAACWRSDNGEELWKGRIAGTFSASPVLAGDTIYATNEEGRTYVFAADPAGFQLLGENQLGDEVFATPAICGGRLYFRVARQQDGARREWLVAVGE